MKLERIQLPVSYLPVDRYPRSAGREDSTEHAVHLDPERDAPSNRNGGDAGDASGERKDPTDAETETKRSETPRTETTGEARAPSDTLAPRGGLLRLTV